MKKFDFILMCICFGYHKVAIAGFSILRNLSSHTDNKKDMRPHIGVVVSLLQEHSSNAEVIESVNGNIIFVFYGMSLT